MQARLPKVLRILPPKAHTTGEKGHLQPSKAGSSALKKGDSWSTPNKSPHSARSGSTNTKTGPPQRRAARPLYKVTRKFAKRSVHFITLVKSSEFFFESFESQISRNKTFRTVKKKKVHAEARARTGHHIFRDKGTFIQSGGEE